MGHRPWSCISWHACFHKCIQSRKSENAPNVKYAQYALYFSWLQKSAFLSVQTLLLSKVVMWKVCQVNCLPHETYFFYLLDSMSLSLHPSRKCLFLVACLYKVNEISCNLTSPSSICNAAQYSPCFVWAIMWMTGDLFLSSNHFCKEIDKSTNVRQLLNCIFSLLSIVFFSLFRYENLVLHK